MPKVVRAGGLADRYNRYPYKKSTALLLILIGIVMIFFPGIYKWGQTMQTNANKGQRVNLTAYEQDKTVNLAQTILASNPFKVDKKMLSDKMPSQAPQRIVIPDLNIDLPVVEAAVKNGFWELSETTASHGVGSANPGENGNIVIFAHARSGLFLPLRNIKSGTNIYVLTKDRWFHFTVNDIKIVMPNQIENIAPSSNEVLTLFTCSGFLDNKRIIVKAIPKN